MFCTYKTIQSKKCAVFSGQGSIDLNNISTEDKLLFIKSVLQNKKLVLLNLKEDIDLEYLLSRHYLEVDKGLFINFSMKNRLSEISHLIKL